MREIFVIYDLGINLPDGGHPIDGGAGGVDRSAPPDGSTMYERIPKILEKYPGTKVVYLPNQDVPDPKKYKIKDDKIVKLTKDDKATIEAKKPKSEIELLKDRVSELEDAAILKLKP